MDAPLYPPASSFVAPVVLPDVIGVDTISLRELLRIQATRDILFANAPGLEAAVSNPGFRPHLGNFTVMGAMRDGLITADAVRQIGAAFARLPADVRNVG